MFSTRLPWAVAANRYTRALAERRESGGTLIDLTRSNPTAAGFEYPTEVFEKALGGAARASYDPDARGSLAARQALAAALSTESDRVDAGSLVLTASTSEAYSFLFKLLADPGDEIVTGRPAYPLLEHIAALEALTLRHYSMTNFRRGGESFWRIELPEVAAAVTPRARAVVVIHPNNPTGNYVSPSEEDDLVAFCAEKQLPLISDEVFHDFVINKPRQRAGSIARRRQGLVFSLGGLSKSAGLPHWKLGWIRVGGAPELAAEALERLELVADSYLSVSTLVQSALPAVLDAAPKIRAQVTARTRDNLETLRVAVSAFSSLELLEPEGGWSAVIRLPRLVDDETLAIALVRDAGVAVQPGYFYDLPEGHVVVSLLGPSDEFREGVDRLCAALRSQSFP